MVDAVPWSAAMAHALYGPSGFYRQDAPPAAHFRTSVVAAPDVMADALLVLLRDVDRALGLPREIDLVDLGAGGGELLDALAAAAPDRVRLRGVDLRPRPTGLPARVAWSNVLPDEIHGVLVANEYLDNVPVEVVEVDAAGMLREVLVEPTTGEELLGGPAGRDDVDWLMRWWPLAGAPPGTRAECGRQRDQAWRAATGRLVAGVAVAVDYHHDVARRPAGGTLTGYRSGRTVRPVPDGSCDLTAHVALDACGSAAEASPQGRLRAGWAVLTQRVALLALGTDRARPPVALASTDPPAYVRALAAAGAVAELLDPAGLGGFGWLVQPVGCELPDRFRSGDHPVGR